LKRGVLGLASLERTIARQRARAAALEDGDANAQFLRIFTAKRSRRNLISTLRTGARVKHEEAKCHHKYNSNSNEAVK
jgi:hypothetical protein